MKSDNTYKWSPEHGNILQEAFSEILSVYTHGVTRNQWVCLYGAFLAGVIMALSSKRFQAPSEEILALVKSEGELVTKMMNEENRKHQNN